MSHQRGVQSRFAVNFMVHVSCTLYLHQKQKYSNFKGLNYTYCYMPGRRTQMQMVFCQECIILPDARIQSFATYYNLSPIYHLYVLFVDILYQARFGLQISYPAISFTILIGFLNCGSFIVHALLPGTSKAFTLSVFLQGTQ